MPLLHGWLVVAEETNVSNDGKKQTVYTWDARCPKECVADLIMFCQNLRAALDARYNQVLPEPGKSYIRSLILRRQSNISANSKVRMESS